jgi:hypothetical protein
MLVLSHRENTNQKIIEILSHPSQLAHYQKNK